MPDFISGHDHTGTIRRGLKEIRRVPIKFLLTKEIRV